MGRLFWKFFLIFWLAQFITAAGVGAAIWMEHSADRSDTGFADPGRPPPLPPDFNVANRLPPPPGFGPPPPHRRPLPLAPVVAGSLVSLIFAALLAWYFARPIRSLRDAFGAVAEGKLDTRIGAAMGGRNDELADLGKNFDDMAGRLQGVMDAQRRLLHDVSHELRSPLARLQAASDLIQQQPERGAEFVERIQRDTQRMDVLVGELLTLARLDAGVACNRDDEVDLYEIITDIVDDARVEADRKCCDIRVDLNDPIVLRGSHELLYRAIENVVRNAVRHSLSGGKVLISAQSFSGLLRVTVADSGPGVAEENLAKIFEPFFRSGTDGATKGYGLGLTITRRVTEAHGGRVFASNQPAGGLLVTMEFQLGKPQSSRGLAI